MINKLLYVTALLSLIACGSDKPKDQNLNKIDSLKINEVVGIANIEPLQRILSIIPQSSGIVKAINVEINQSTNPMQSSAKQPTLFSRTRLNSRSYISHRVSLLLNKL